MTRVAVAVVAIVACARVAVADRPEPPPQAVPGSIAVVILLQGDGVYYRNGTGVDLEDARFAAIQLALDTVAEDAPPNALGAVIVYADGAATVRPMGPMATLRGDVLIRRTADAVLPRDLVAGVDAALAALEAAPASHRALVIFGDGADSDLARARPALDTLRARADRAGIAIYAIHHDYGIGDDNTAIRSLAIPSHDTRAVLDIVPAFQTTFRALGADATSQPAAAPAAPARTAAVAPSRTLAWSLLGAGIVLAALGAGVLARRRTARV